MATETHIRPIDKCRFHRRDARLHGEGETGTGRETGLGQKVRPGPVEKPAWAVQELEQRMEQLPKERREIL
jgi:hypothetical protein